MIRKWLIRLLAGNKVVILNAHIDTGKGLVFSKEQLEKAMIEKCLFVGCGTYLE